MIPYSIDLSENVHKSTCR